MSNCNAISRNNITLILYSKVTDSSSLSSAPFYASDGPMHSTPMGKPCIEFSLLLGGNRTKPEMRQKKRDRNGGGMRMMEDDRNTIDVRQKLKVTK